MRSLEEIREAVRRGAEQLDRIYGGDTPWFLKVDKETLQIRNVHHCIAGQLYGNYNAYLHKLAASLAPSIPQAAVLQYEVADEVMINFGFILTWNESYDDSLWTSLENFWRDEINARRQKMYAVT